LDLEREETWVERLARTGKWKEIDIRILADDFE
jgi:hypothetical protein